MALVARAAMQNPVAGAAGARAPQTLSSVASSRSQIDELSGSASVSFDQSTYLLPDDFSHELPDHRNQAHGQDRDGRGRGAVPTPTTNATFDALFRLTEFKGTEVEAKPHVRGAKGFGGMLGKVIGTYEQNAKVIHGEIIPRGSTLRLAV